MHIFAEPVTYIGVLYGHSELHTVSLYVSLRVCLQLPAVSLLA